MVSFRGRFMASSSLWINTLSMTCRWEMTAQNPPTRKQDPGLWTFGTYLAVGDPGFFDFLTAFFLTAIFVGEGESTFLLWKLWVKRLQHYDIYNDCCQSFWVGKYLVPLVASVFLLLSNHQKWRAAWLITKVHWPSASLKAPVASFRFEKKMRNIAFTTISLHHWININMHQNVGNHGIRLQTIQPLQCWTRTNPDWGYPGISGIFKVFHCLHSGFWWVFGETLGLPFTQLFLHPRLGWTSNFHGDTPVMFMFVHSCIPWKYTLQIHASTQFHPLTFWPIPSLRQHQGASKLLQFAYSCIPHVFFVGPFLPGSLNNHFLIDFCWNNHFLHKDLESSHWNND